MWDAAKVCVCVCVYVVYVGIRAVIVCVPVYVCVRLCDGLPNSCPRFRPAFRPSSFVLPHLPFVLLPPYRSFPPLDRPSECPFCPEGLTYTCSSSCLACACCPGP